MKKIKPQLLSWILRTMPNFLWPFKVFLIRKSIKQVGEKFRFGPNSVFSDHRLIEVGKNVFFSDGTIINTVVSVKIGNNVMFGPQVMIMGGDHNFKVSGKRMIDVKEGGLNIPVIIEDDVWIGSRCIILKGVIIAEGTVVAAGSIVTKTLPPYAICMGNPCKPLKCRFSKEELIEHLEIVKSKYSFEEIVDLYQIWNLIIS
jgi:acetyltransferase-like isoleucine patch superfamily enzyme